jgi:hypothetical protein
MKNNCLLKITNPLPRFEKGVRRFPVLLVLALAFLFSGCEVLEGLNSGGGKPAPRVAGTPVPGAAEMSDGSIKEKFGVTETGTAGVEAAFKELSAFIKSGGLGFDPPVVKLGDWIDLEGGLTVDAYENGDNTGGFSFKDEDMLWNSDLTLNTLPWGKMMRLIVVGINSFNGIKDNDTQHVVFQFQNVPVLCRMNPASENNPYGTNKGGYHESEMRKYLVPVGEDKESGKFLAGLTNAGVPEGVLWGPSRVLSTKGKGLEPINDLLWLPTEREMFGVHAYSVDKDETDGNQARLGYYADSAFLQKLYKDNSGYPNVDVDSGNWYWEASVSADASSFCLVRYYGNASYHSANGAGGCAPAFCVK